MRTERIVYCADVIARLNGPSGPFVLVERLGVAKGIALPGGKQEAGESLSCTAIREFEEETGLSLTLLETLGTKAEAGRDSRGRYVSTVFLGVAHGTPRNEHLKTRVVLLSEEEIACRKHALMFDHLDIIGEHLGWDRRQQ